ncbi:MAG: diguanylate cyclase [Burkholderiales bacterium]|nr:diguanylate cyclase [Burkholderiales bacterium]
MNPTSLPNSLNSTHIPITQQRALSVLIVDDTPANIGLLRNMLAPEGYQIFAATSGEMALKIAHINKPVRIEEVNARVRTQLQIKREQENVRDQAERMRAIVNNMAEGLLIIEPGGRIQFANPAACHFLHYSDDGLVGASVADILDPEIRTEYIEYFAPQADIPAACAKLPHGTREIGIVRCDGSSGFADMTLSMVFLREPLYIALLHDITAHKQTEDAWIRTAEIDPLTNIANRRRFDATLRREWQRALRNGTPITLMLLDVDQFKLYNDNLGHQAGDRCLQQVALAIQTQARRPLDLAARYGGEEFVLLLPETAATVAAKLAENVRAKIESLQLPHPQSSVGPYVTVSIGVAIFDPGQEMDAERLIKAADDALYRAKEAGRNRIELAE